MKKLFKKLFTKRKKKKNNNYNERDRFETKRKDNNLLLDYYSVLLRSGH